MNAAPTVEIDLSIRVEGQLEGDLEDVVRRHLATIGVDPDREVRVKMTALQAERCAFYLQERCAGPVPPDRHDLYPSITALFTAARHGESR